DRSKGARMNRGDQKAADMEGRDTGKSRAQLEREWNSASRHELLAGHEMRPMQAVNADYKPNSHQAMWNMVHNGAEPSAVRQAAAEYVQLSGGEAGAAHGDRPHEVRADGDADRPAAVRTETAAPSRGRGHVDHGRLDERRDHAGVRAAAHAQRWRR